MTELGPRGARLWAAYCGEVDGQRGLVLLEEACRVADRLDRLDALLVGESAVWFRLVEDRGGDLEVRVDGALAEARQQQNILRQLIVSMPRRESGDADVGDAWLDDVSAEVLDPPG